MDTGIYAGAKDKLQKFPIEERKIISIFARKYWRVTRAEILSLSNSIYRIILIKPTETITHSFNLQREVVAVFSPYDTFQPRSIDAIDYLDIQALRLEEICCILISKDKNIEQSISQLIKSNQETRVIVPFSYDELLSNGQNDEFISNKIRRHFYSRDLFGIQSPLKKDLYFFGRNDIIQELVNKHLNNENAGVFGLRKTGKTSILYGVERVLEKKHSMSLLIDCQTLHMKSWNMALYYIIERLFQKSSNVRQQTLHTQHDYEDGNFASDYFESDIQTIFKKDKRHILLIFDEIEHITFGTSVSKNWNSGMDFIKFWQVLRSSYQKNMQGVFSYLITGTNPRCVEMPTIDSVDNPIFMQFTPQYMPPFDFPQTSEMLNKLGGYMGLTFDTNVITSLVDDFGGHPLLMRQMCSYIHRHSTDSRPHNVVKVEYEEAKKLFYEADAGFVKYTEMVLEVLRNWYPDEYQMLQWLSVGDETTFNGLASLSTTYTDHLTKYGIIDCYKGKYFFRNEALKLYLDKQNRYKKLNLTSEEKQQEISSRRNRLEPQLRRLVRSTLKLTLGEQEAKKKVITEVYGSKEVSRRMSENYTDFFDSSKHKIYLSNLFSLIRKNWENGFRNIFGDNVELFEAKAKIINYDRKADAHATELSESEFTSFRGAMQWMEEQVANYFNS